ncbi:hypothetical protein TWF718_005333 [Orbilia javanica]|uniref:Uncharacterized protein n=1 Tax=Orbilia javanica TaxID=47235 RepID=A0AAN8MUT7_9PEZI
MFFRDGTKCKFGPLDFTIGIKRADGATVCAYYVNRDVFLALAPNFEQEFDYQQSRSMVEITEFYLPFEPGKKELLKSFATFINEGTVVSPQYGKLSEPDTLLFLYNFATVMGCGLLKHSIITRINSKMPEYVHQIKASLRGQNFVWESEAMEWVNAFYECSSIQEVKEYKMWRMVEAVLGRDPWIKMEVLGIRAEKHWDCKLRTQIYENMQLLCKEPEPQVGYSHGEAVRGGQDRYETDTEDEAGDFESSDAGGDDHYMWDGHEDQAPVEELRQRVMYMEIATNEMEEDF